MIARAIRPDLTHKVWPLIEQWVGEALTHGGGNDTPEKIRTALIGGTMQLWLAWDGSRAHGCCITELFESPRGKTCGLVIVSGRGFENWRHLIEPIKAWAVAEGCSRMEAGGRDGWGVHLKRDGWRRVRTVIEMDL